MYLQVYSRIQRLVRLRNLYLWHSHKTLHIIREMVQRLLNESTVAIVQIRLEAEGIKGGIEGFWLHWRSFCVNGSANHHLKERFLWKVTVCLNSVLHRTTVKPQVLCLPKQEQHSFFGFFWEIQVTKNSWTRELGQFVLPCSLTT